MVYSAPLLLFVIGLSNFHLPALSPELEDIQGTWECDLQLQGKKLRLLKTVEGNVERLEMFEGDKLVHRHLVKLEVVDATNVTLMRYSEPEIVFGPAQGQHRPSGTFVSKRFQNRWYNIVGLDGKNDVPMQVFEFVRKSDPTRE